MSGGDPGDDEAFELPLDGELDLHASRPADVVGVVEGYVKACRQRGVLRLRLAHGKGTGAQRASVWNGYQLFQRRLRDQQKGFSDWKFFELGSINRWSGWKSA